MVFNMNTMNQDLLYLIKEIMVINFISFLREKFK